jgi:ketosteroid isomerase-like protein
MADGNVAVVRRMYERWNDGEVDAALRDHWHDDAVMHFPEGFPDPGPWEGLDEISAHFHRLREDFSQQRAELHDPETHGDWVLIRSVWKVRGDRSGIPGELGSYAAFRVVDGRVAEARYFLDRAEAREAIGAEE